MPRRSSLLLLAILSLVLSFCAAARAAETSPQWLDFPGGDGPGKGKTIVCVSGDEEYRSEEGLPQLAAIFSKHHGFHCIVLFEIDPKTGLVEPNQHDNIPGIDALDHADLMVILTRWRALPDDQMAHIEAFLQAGKPVIGLRTATHAFDKLKGTYEKYNSTYKGPEAAWKDGFGRLVLGETWINHHGSHKNESTRGRFAPDAAGNPLLNGIADGEIWTPTDVYGVRLPLPGDSKPLILGEVCPRPGKMDKSDPMFGMRPADQAKVGDPKNNPMMPIAWTHTYQLPGGKPGKAFASTMGAAIDLTNEPLRRLLANAVYALLDLKVPEKADVTLVGDFKPSTFGFNGGKHGLTPADFRPKE